MSLWDLLASHKIAFVQAKLVITELEVHAPMLMTYLIPVGLSLNQYYEYCFESYFSLSSRMKYLDTNLFQYTFLECFSFLYIYKILYPILKKKKKKDFILIQICPQLLSFSPMTEAFVIPNKSYHKTLWDFLRRIVHYQTHSVYCIVGNEMFVKYV